MSIWFTMTFQPLIPSRKFLHEFIRHTLKELGGPHDTAKPTNMDQVIMEATGDTLQDL